MTKIGDPIITVSRKYNVRTGRIAGISPRGATFQVEWDGGGKSTIRKKSALLPD
jgi:hypothetical protein